MAFNWICITIVVLLCLCSFTMAAPSGENLSKFSEMERTFKEFAATVLAIGGAAIGNSGAGEGSFSEADMEALGTEAAAALMDLNEFSI